MRVPTSTLDLTPSTFKVPSRVLYCAAVLPHWKRPTRVHNQPHNWLKPHEMSMRTPDWSWRCHSSRAPVPRQRRCSVLHEVVSARSCFAYSDPRLAAMQSPCSNKLTTCFCCRAETLTIASKCSWTLHCEYFFFCKHNDCEYFSSKRCKDSA